MSASEEPMVSVFHFTSRISSAKIRKYKIATEKGMGPGRTPTPGPGNKTTTPSPALAPSPMDPPPKKKPRLRLSVSKPAGPSQSQSHSQSPDTIAVSRPKRASTQNARYSEDAMDVDLDVDEDDVTDTSKLQAPVASPAESSELSSLSSIAPLENEPTPAAQPVKKGSGRPTDYGRDFMSYYVDGGEDEAEAVEDIVEVPAVRAAPAAVPTVVREAPATQAPVQLPVRAPDRPSQQVTRPRQAPFSGFHNHSGPPGPYPTSAKEPKPEPPPPPPPLQPPVVYINDDFMRLHGPWPQMVVARMVMIITELSNLLADFNGVPPIPRSVSPEPSQRRPLREAGANAQPNAAADVRSTACSSKSTSDQGKKAADTLLAAFGDDDEDDEDSDTSEKAEPQQPTKASVQSQAPAQIQAPGGNSNNNNNPPHGSHQIPVTNVQDVPLPDGGELDISIIHGIRFIMNALKSWAQGRLTQQYQAYYYNEHFRAQQAQAARDQASRRGPGRPRKFDDFDPNRPLPAPVIYYELLATHEGRTIQLFQEVISSGCLRVNVKYPKDLARSLRILYMQIDQLINKTNTGPEAPWQCMSYGAQINAHKRTVQKVKEAQARAQAEIERQTFFSQRHVMEQMGITPASSGNGIQQPFRQPHPSSYQASNPTSHANRPGAGAGAYNSVPPYAQNGMQGSSNQPQGAPSPYLPSNATAGVPQAAPVAINGVPVPASPSGGPGVNLLSRSGGAMKFSFQEGGANSNVPVRAPTNNNTMPYLAPANNRTSNGAGSPPSNFQPLPPNAPALARVPSDTIQVAAKPAARRVPRVSPPVPDIPAESGSYNTFAVNGRAPAQVTPNNGANAMNGTNGAVNASGATPSPMSRPSSASARTRQSMDSGSATPPVTKATTKAAASTNANSASGSAKSG